MTRAAETSVLSFDYFGAAQVSPAIVMEYQI
jgi:hypothetical protein